MENDNSESVTLRALPLTKTCFADANEMLREFAAHLVVPAQAGRDGKPGEDGKATDGKSVQFSSVNTIAETGVTFVDVNADLENGFVSLVWSSSSSPSPVIYVTYAEKLSQGRYRVHFNEATGSVKGWVVKSVYVS